MNEFDKEKAQIGLEKLKAAFIECNRIEYEKTKKELRSTEKIEPSDRYKRGINRIFRERHGIKNIPYPEVDNAFERTRSFFARGIYLITKR
ncbi:MAG: hypothetical protein IJX55_03930 [Clostridia bacterium]|nr:hypothetical protein [Clostridia bacterium]